MQGAPEHVTDPTSRWQNPWAAVLGASDSLKNQVTNAEQEQPGFQRWLMVQLTQRLLPVGQGHSIYMGPGGLHGSAGQAPELGAPRSQLALVTPPQPYSELASRELV